MNSAVRTWILDSPVLNLEGLTEDGFIFNDKPVVGQFVPCTPLIEDVRENLAALSEVAVNLSGVSDEYLIHLNFLLGLALKEAESKAAQLRETLAQTSSPKIQRRGFTLALALGQTSGVAVTIEK